LEFADNKTFAALGVFWAQIGKQDVFARANPAKTNFNWNMTPGGAKPALLG
jgi:hypothetical protein